MSELSFCHRMTVSGSILVPFVASEKPPESAQSCVLLVIAILLQSSGAGLSGVFGGDSAIYTTRRGPVKFLYWLTVVLALIFVGLAIASLILK